jgi:hypothetical protein
LFLQSLSDSLFAVSEAIQGHGTASEVALLVVFIAEGALPALDFLG